jgi:membrane protein YdbS with pleckstrin-like domain
VEAARRFSAIHRSARASLKRREPSCTGTASPDSTGTAYRRCSGRRGAAATRPAEFSRGSSVGSGNERTCFRTSLHWIVFVRYGALALAAFLFGAIPFAIGVQAITGMEFGWFALPLPLFILVAPAVAYWSSELVVTERRIRINTGVLRRQTMEMFITKVESIAVDQGFLGRMWDFGTVMVRGSGGSSEPFEAIAHPIAFRDAVQQLQSGERLPEMQRGA